nr:hypothetical protein [Tanacetum cinerariifolium]
YFPEFTQIVKFVLSRRNNQVPLSSVKLNIQKDGVASWDIEILIKYILSHNVQQVDVECMVWHSFLDRVNGDSEIPVTLFSSQSLKRLTMEGLGLTASSTLELPALTTLHLSCVELYPDANTLFSKCPNLKNLTLKSCDMNGSDSLISICHYQLSNLTLEHDMDSVMVVNVVAPQLENLTIRYHFEDFESRFSFFGKGGSLYL